MRIEAHTPSPATENTAQLREAASAFEAMLLQQILRTAVPGTGDAREGLALQAVAADLAPAIDFGLARLLEKQA